MYRDTANVESEVTIIPRKTGNYTRKTFDRFTTKTAILGTSHIIRKVLQCEV